MTFEEFKKKCEAVGIHEKPLGTFEFEEHSPKLFTAVNKEYTEHNYSNVEYTDDGVWFVEFCVNSDYYIDAYENSLHECLLTLASELTEEVEKLVEVSNTLRSRAESING